jgi:tRNA threonylcarbamoyladenosine biosynthesis protein TsaB
MSFTLAIDTATPQVSVALGGPDGVVGEVNLRPGRRHGEVLAPAIESLLRLTGVRLDQVERIGVDTGPGLFTGLRVGVATAKALASALDVPVVPCTSLDLLAHPHRGSDALVAAVVDARRGEVFWALYQPALGGSAVVQATDPAVSDPDEVATSLPYAADRVLVAGDGARRYAARMTSVPGLRLAGPEFDHPRASVLLALVGTRPALPAEKVTPTYLRGADVRIGWTQRDG